MSSKQSKSEYLPATILFASVLVLPWFFGGHLPIVRTLSLALSVPCLLICLASMAGIGTPTKKELAIKLLLLVGIAYGLLQLFPLVGGQPITQYPAATRAALGELVLGVAVFAIANHVLRNQNLIAWFFGFVALNGVLITFVGLAQLISDSDRLYWYFELNQVGQPFGPYVNGNNAAGYLLMSFAAANFFLAREVFRYSHQLPSNQSTKKQSLLVRVIRAIGIRFARLESQQLYILAALVTIAVGIFASLSRGAAVSLVASALIGWMLLFRRTWGVLVMTAVTLVVGVATLFWLQQDQAVAKSLSTLANAKETSPNRIAHWKIAWECAQENLPFGAGLGTYRVAYLPFQIEPFKRWFLHAENQYLEAFVEMGWLGLGLLLAAAALSVYGCFRLLAKPDSTSRAVGLAGLICLIGQLMASLFDFGWYMPANLVLMAAMMGAIYGQLNWSWSASHVGQAKPPGVSLRVAATRLILLVLAGLAAWSAYEYSAVDARQSCRRFYERFDPSRDRFLLPDYQALAEYAVKLRPDDAEAHYQLALNHVLQYRVKATDQMVDVPLASDSEASGSSDEPVGEVSSELAADESVESSVSSLTFAAAWPQSTLVTLHRLARMAANAPGTESVPAGTYLNELKSEPLVEQHLTPAWDHLKIANENSDRFWFIPMARAQLSLLMEDDVQEATYIRDAIDISAQNPEVLFIAGILRVQSNDLEGACDLWRKCLEQTREFETEIVELAKRDIPIRDLLEKVLPSEPHFRLRVVRKFFRQPEELLARKLILNDSKMKLDQHDLPEAELHYLKGEMERYSENYPLAIAHYAQALDLDKHRADWRVNYARALIEADQLDQAYGELKRCELYHGNHHVACQSLMRRLKRLRSDQLRNLGRQSY